MRNGSWTSDPGTERPGRGRRRLSIRWVALIVTLSACHSYVPLSTGFSTHGSAPPSGPSALGGESALERGDGLQVHLAEPVPVPLRDVTVTRAAVVRGEFVQWAGSGSDRSLVLSALRVRTMDGVEHAARGVTVRVPTGSIARLEVKRFDVTRSLFAGLPLGLAAALIPTLVTGQENSGGSGGPAPAPQ